MKDNKQVAIELLQAAGVPTTESHINATIKHLENNDDVHYLCDSLSIPRRGYRQAFNKYWNNR